MYDWASTPYFPMPMDQAGYVRINLKGRERDGIVAPGRDYEALCERLESYFYGIQDADSGKPLVKNITRVWQETPASAAARSVLPDLLIRWGELALGEVGSLRCDALPYFHLDVPKKTVSGRSGNHMGRGWFVAAGSEIRQQSLRGYTIRDLAPTVFQQLGTPLLDSFSGRPIPLRNPHDH
jgi:predicted AlkP superfamily phosphohydrolase/phosphomutase